MKEKVRVSKVINYAGAFIALLIGSGFATGQELLQFFASYGLPGLLGVIVCFVLFAFVGVEFVTYGKKYHFENPNNVYKAICGDKLGTFYDYFSVFFLFLSFTVMVAGAQATFVQQYNAPKFIGGAILGLAALITVIFGLSKIVDVIGKIGPVIVVLAIFIGVASIVQNFSNFDAALASLENLNANNKIIRATDLGFLPAALTYVGFNMIWLAAFCAQVGRDADNFEEARRGQIAGAGGFALALLIMAFGIILSIDNVYNSQIPTLILANQINPVIATIFSVCIVFGIYTSAVPLLWSVIARFFKEGTKQFKLATVLIGLAGIIVGLTIDFDVLVNYVYVINGWLGFLLLVIMIVRFFQRRSKKEI